MNHLRRWMVGVDGKLSQGYKHYDEGKKPGETPERPTRLAATAGGDLFGIQYKRHTAFIKFYFAHTKFFEAILEKFAVSGVGA
jgi:hypothetical protein